MELNLSFFLSTSQKSSKRLCLVMLLKQKTVKTLPRYFPKLGRKIQAQWEEGDGSDENDGDAKTEDFNVRNFVRKKTWSTKSCP